MYNNFDLQTFIQQSNLIDPQYDERGNTIPGFEPGDILYDNQIDAIDLAVELLKTKNPPLDTCKQVHRELTKNIWFFERCIAPHNHCEDGGCFNGSGRYRPYNVRVGNQSLPSYEKVEDYVENRWIPCLNEKLNNTTNSRFDGMKLHYAYECIHPFIDGNGRSGRILLLSYWIATNTDPIIIYYDSRYQYYRDIQKYRQLEFNKWLETYNGKSIS